MKTHIEYDDFGEYLEILDDPEMADVLPDGFILDRV